MADFTVHKNIIEAFNGADEDRLRVEESVQWTLQQLEDGKLRVAEPLDGTWVVNEWIKKAILLFFQLTPNRLCKGGFDKVPLQFTSATEQDFIDRAIRVMPGALIRKGAYIGPNAVVLNSFINIGAYIADGTMIDSFATIGSCAQIGKSCHIAAGAVIGGVLEPLRSCPVIIEDNCLIGANVSIVEGVRVRSRAIVATGVHASASTKIIHRATGEIIYGEIPAGSVAIPGTYSVGNGLSVNCVIITKDSHSVDIVNQELRGHDVP